ncbi:hypothetical protein M3Y97_00490300 [Aphelenchoides bicaudatus]|nr:hypothetical protein M3Y97_00490300 [Aphelenchoides bicaudatus]
MLQRRGRISREDYKPLTLENNLKSGKWSLAQSVKRHGFIDIMEEGERVGLVMCSTCGLVCSKNSFRKIRTHDCNQPNGEEYSEQILPSSTKTQRILEKLAHAKKRQMANVSASESPPQSPSVFPEMSSMSPEPSLNLSEILQKSGFKIELDEEEETPSPQSEPIENVLLKIASSINPKITNDDEEPTSSIKTKPRQFNPHPPKRSAQFLPKRVTRPMPSSIGSSTNSIASTSSSIQQQNDGDIIGTMVNSTYRTLVAQNRRLAIEFKCCVMNVISEYEMLLLEKESKGNDE